MLELLILFLTVILLIHLIKLTKPNIIQETFIDNIASMEQKMKQLEEKEKETRMFCKILRNKDKQDNMDYMITNTNMKFQNEWKKQNILINDLKKIIINLKLDKNDKEFINFNESKNQKNKSFLLRQKQIKLGKEKLKGPRILNLKINNNL
jgi:hypothetical protein